MGLSDPRSPRSRERRTDRAAPTGVSVPRGRPETPPGESRAVADCELAPQTMEPGLFRSFCRIAREQGGIAIREGKEALVTARVAKRQRALGIATARKYLRYLEADESGEELIHFLDAISTNFTSFLREPEHFAILSRHIGELLSRGQRRLRLWSAACSSGEEPYSIAMTALETIGERTVDLRILATDLSTAALSRARDGRYSSERVAPLSRLYRTKYFTTHGRRSEGQDDL